MLSALIIGSTAPAPTPASAPTAIVEHVVDGDTFTVRIDRRRERVRLIGIDAPEATDPRRIDCFGPESTTALQSLLPAGSTVILTSDTGAGNRDRFDRLLRYAQTPSVGDIGAAQLAAGMAEPYRKSRHARRTQYAALAADATRLHTGLHGACR